ncbi:MAG: hypothetical protein PHI97_28775 [Desulfobulbus sp.]|nr:hypothetical protein [Desulfobulbus sp.]
MVKKRFYNIEEMSIILGKSIAAVHGHLARKQFDAVPPPMKLGRRLAWLVESVDLWIEQKSREAATQWEKHQDFVQAAPKKRGRPTKVEMKARSGR